MINQDIQSRVDAFRGNPDALAQRYQQNQQLIDLLALQKIKSEKEAAARQMQMQMAQQQAKQGQPPTVAEQREQEVLDLTKNEVQQQQNSLRAQQQQQQQSAMQKLLSGIAAAPGAMSAAQPQAMAAGGIVAFAEGGRPIDKIREDLARETDPAKREALTQELKNAEAAQETRPPGLPTPESATARYNAALAQAFPAQAARRLGAGITDIVSLPGKLAWERDPQTGQLRRQYERTGFFPASRGVPDIERGIASTYTEQIKRQEEAAAQRRQPGFINAQGRPIVDQIPGQTPPTSPSFEDAIRQARGQELPPPAETAPPAPPVPRPAAPAAPMATQPPAQPGAVTAGPEMVSPAEIAAAQKMRREALDQNPETVRAAEEARAAGVYGVPAAYRDLLAKRQSELAASTQVDPSKRFLDRLGILAAAGMQDRGRWYGIGPGATPGLMAYDEAAAKRQAAADEAVFNLSKGLMESERTGGIEAYKAGRGALEKAETQREKAAGDVTQLQRAQQTALDSALDRQSKERIAQEENAIRREANRLQAESVGETRSARVEANQQRLTLDVANFERRLFEEITKTPEPFDIMAIKTKMANKKPLSGVEQAAYNKFENDRKLALAGARNQANELRRELGLPTRATPSAPDDKPEGFSLTKVTPSK